LCSFNQSGGIYACQQKIDGARLTKATGYTNLDRALASSSDFDLSVIITDGVPSGASSGGPNHCVGSGVDAGCVADAMAEAMKGPPGTSKEQMRGVWIIPTILQYRGTFFVEQKIEASEFDRDKAETSVNNALGVNARIEHPRSSTDGTLVFDYDGPRYLLAIVVGNVSSGRAFLQEFYSQTDFSHIVKLPTPNSYGKQSDFRPSILPAIEIFPSTLPPQAFEGCQQARDARQRIVGGLVNCRTPEFNRLRLSCGQSAKTTLELNRQISADPMRIFTVAPVRFHNSGGSIVKALEIPIQSSGLSQIRVKVSCDGGKRVACGSAESNTQLTTTPDFQAAADAMITGNTQGAKYINAMSTRTPGEDPEKVYGLGDLLQNFYRRQLPIGTSQFAALEVCQE
jgi:hypothetical protein